ncbi:branched-chain amino acid ABC transporter permease [Candidatus Bathyarchaeota archaeon]|nr:branched-chain amino acid ABC transporter permease [Candidatus Bathyarchaeota archaeon]
MMINWLQVLMNSIVWGCMYMLATVGLSLSYGLSRFPNFAHAEYITFGAYMAFLFLVVSNLDIYLAVGLAVVLSAFMGGLSYLILFKPLKSRGASLVHLMVSSIGLGFLIRHFLMQTFGGGIQSFRIVWPTISIGPIVTTPLLLAILIVALVIAFSLHILLTKTKLGKAIRATADNPELAAASGIDLNKVSLFTWSLGAALAGFSGIFLAMRSSLVPLIGWKVLLQTFAITLLGGVGSFYGVLIASFILGLSENVGVVILTWLGLSADYRSAVAFIILVATLILKPEGLMAVAKRRA